MSGASAVSVSSDQPPAPPLTEFNEPFLRAAREHKFTLARCNACGFYIYPHGPVCPNCFEQDMTWTELSGHGVVRSWVSFHKAYHPYFENKLPVTVAFVELREGPRMVANIRDIDRDHIHMDLEVEAYFEDYDGFTLIQFRPVKAA